jgi:hypothetical protein
MSEDKHPDAVVIAATADEIIADCGGDARAAVIELVAIVPALGQENKTLREAASPGFARRRPIVFGKPQ